jgi:hypothetical protein
MTFFFSFSPRVGYITISLFYLKKNMNKNESYVGYSKKALSINSFLDQHKFCVMLVYVGRAE